jgi:BMFP domain-containing protein YqiC
MQTKNRMLDDLAKVANGAASTLAGIKGELEALVRQQIDRFLSEMDVVPRDEFEAIKAVAAKARAEQEKLEDRVAALEAALSRKAAEKPKPSPVRVKKTSPRKRRPPKTT